MPDLRFGDLILDETCLFARRNEQTIKFTRNERALLLALTRNPRRLMRRGRLLDELASESDISDRNIDFLVNRLRSKLGDSARSPKYIATQYGEGYVWIAAPSSGTIACFLAIAPTFGPQGHRFGQQASSLVGQIRDMIAGGLGRDVVVVEDGYAAASSARYVLQMSFLAGNESLDCAATLRDMPSRRIVKAFRLHFDMADAGSLATEVRRISDGVVDALSQALIEASTGLGTPADEPLETRFHKAASLLSASNRAWLASGEQLGKDRAHAPLNADIALQWCLHLFARLVHTSPFGEISLEERYRIESEIDATVLECLPAVEANPLLMLAAAKLLYFIDRGHLDLSEDIAGRAFARTADSGAALPVMGQLCHARGRFDEAIGFFDRGIETFEPDCDLHLHMRVLKAISVLASGDRAALDTSVADAARENPRCPRDIGLTIGWMVAAPEQELPAASADALAAIGPAGARNAIEYLYFTSARHLISEAARANVMRGLIAHVMRLHGNEAVPAFVLRSIGPIAA
ncbi:winged helix-turn-helix domain-containing protein [Bradyrhizobium sacchari]|uniref:Transcriptional regulator n=1 Tax=Bradyrhizobium sacchari TaxID=1399419 RepID=A0A560KE20_9BRAD|nr:winged helix-turn-helix domain-containing protein [Bradyrhizobium sacchari]TWB65272.1 transcriptional regulator [Bradyrhizobium sacchari]TWB81595.1 transcriptional regulator [Bradyrhizobium sacchari]